MKLLGFSKSCEGEIPANGLGLFPDGLLKSSSRSTNFTNFPINRSGTVPVSPFLCLAIITSPIPMVERPFSSSVSP